MYVRIVYPTSIVEGDIRGERRILYRTTIFASLASLPVKDPEHLACEIVVAVEYFRKAGSLAAGLLVLCHGPSVEAGSLGGPGYRLGTCPSSRSGQKLFKEVIGTVCTFVHIISCFRSSAVVTSRDIIIVIIIATAPRGPYLSKICVPIAQRVGFVACCSACLWLVACCLLLVA
jgi:hypothetical protein